MANFTIYKTDTGEILSNGTTNASIEDFILEDGQSIIEGIYEVSEYKIIDASPVEQSIDFWETIRLQRNELLNQSDWTQINDSPLSDSKKQEWATYRQLLRDLPNTYQSVNNIADVIFPTIPE
jgi:hypothetical protein